jgi:hypothetical protein
MTTVLWSLHGSALALGDAVGRHGTAPYTISDSARTAGYTLVEVFPIRIHLEATGPRRHRQTIDFGLGLRLSPLGRSTS